MVKEAKDAWELRSIYGVKNILHELILSENCEALRQELGISNNRMINELKTVQGYNYKLAPIHLAVNLLSYEKLELLLLKGANSSLPDALGNRPMDYLAEALGDFRTQDSAVLILDLLFRHGGISEFDYFIETFSQKIPKRISEAILKRHTAGAELAALQCSLPFNL